MEVYLIRHTTPDVAKGICYGQTDLKLKASFPEEAERVLQQLPQDLDAVYSSPLQRCVLLAEKISSNYKTDARLMEFNFGAWEMQAWDDIPVEEIQPWYDDFVHVKARDGESYVEMAARVQAFMTELRTTPYSKVAVVCHSAVIRSILAAHHGVALKDSFDKFGVGYGEVLKIKC